MRIRFVPCKHVTGALIDEVEAFSRTSYAISREALAAKLRSGDRLATARTPDGSLKAVAVITTRRLEDEGGAYRVITTSHVITAPDVRGGTILHRFGMRSVARERLRRPFTPLYWFFVTANFRSYLLMVRNFARFLPDPAGRDEPLRSRAESAARALLGEQWTGGPATRLGASSFGALRPHEYRIPEVSDDARVYVDHFLRLNPRYAESFGLICFCPLDWGNLFHMVLRLFRKSLALRATSPRDRRLT